jgi:glucokinase
VTHPTGLAVGVDLGGTKIAAGLVDREHGSVTGYRTIPTPVADGGQAVLNACAELASLVAEETGHTRLPVGIGICELVDPRGRPTSAVTVDWRGLDVPGAFSALGLATVASDVRAGAAAEAAFGAGQGFDHFLYLTVGTGISYCLVADGVPYAGAHGAAIMVGAPEIETEAAGPAIAAAAGVPTPQALADPRYAGIVHAAASKTGAALAFLVNALDPQAIVIGGGLGIEPRYHDGVIDQLRSLVTTDTARGIPVVPARLGSKAGVVGAALAAPSC